MNDRDFIDRAAIALYAQCVGAAENAAAYHAATRQGSRTVTLDFSGYERRAFDLAEALGEERARRGVQGASVMLSPYEAEALRKAVANTTPTSFAQRFEDAFVQGGGMLIDARVSLRKLGVE
jgi:hypothetical protein